MQLKGERGKWKKVAPPPTDRLKCGNCGEEAANHKEGGREGESGFKTITKLLIAQWRTGEMMCDVAQDISTDERA